MSFLLPSDQASTKRLLPIDTSTNADYLFLSLEWTKHYDQISLVLPDHLPELLHCVVVRSLGCNESLFSAFSYEGLSLFLKLYYIDIVGIYIEVKIITSYAILTEYRGDLL